MEKGKDIRLRRAPPTGKKRGNPMKKALLLTIAMTVFAVVGSQAANTTAVLGGGVCINEILADPVGYLHTHDTDGNGVVVEEEEFVELYNSSDSPVDISGWELWHTFYGLCFTFPGEVDSGTTMLPAGAVAVIVMEVDTANGGTTPTPDPPGSLAFNAAHGSVVLANSGDSIIILDRGPYPYEYIQAYYNGRSDVVPAYPIGGTNTFRFFPTQSCVRVGPVTDFGWDVDGRSMARVPDGDDAIDNDLTDNTAFGLTATPGKVNTTSLPVELDVFSVE
ncbi:MAG: hypothetical protein PWP23_1323 [Candidatus Sumerlaeota bacterium]|nr:hypothetical protein [Candidatus Sumerlaeota bacterium]